MTITAATEPNQKPIRIAINACMVLGGRTGGVEFVVKELIKALGNLKSNSEEYFILIEKEDAHAFQAIIGPNTKLVIVPGSPWFRRIRKLMPHWLESLKLTGKVFSIGKSWLKSRTDFSQAINAPAFSALVDSLNCDVVHFPFQRFTDCKTPAVFNPHDLQHLHYPSFFHDYDILKREALYRQASHKAKAIAVSSEWIKQDIISQYDIKPDKIFVIPWGIHRSKKPESVVADQVTKKLHLKEKYLLYPAATWEHKNHKRLLSALAYLRDEHGLRYQLICTGHKTPFWPSIKAHIEKHNLFTQVIFTGVLSRPDLDALYKAGAIVIVPSLFEASSALLREAWVMGAPVATSRVTSLPAQAGNAALLFDPTDKKDTANTIKKIMEDTDLQNTLRENGYKRAALFPWSRTAEAYRALYRWTAGQPLNISEDQLLHEDIMEEGHTSPPNHALKM